MKDVERFIRIKYFLDDMAYVEATHPLRVTDGERKRIKEVKRRYARLILASDKINIEAKSKIPSEKGLKSEVDDLYRGAEELKTELRFRYL